MFAETLAAATSRGEATFVPIVPFVDVRFSVGVVMSALLVMLLWEVIDTDVLPLTALVRLTPPLVAVSDTVSPVSVPPVLVILVPAVTSNAPPPAPAVPAWELPEKLMLPAVERKMP